MLIPWRAIFLATLVAGISGFLAGLYVANTAGEVRLLAQEKAAKSTLDTFKAAAADAKAKAEKAAADKLAADQKASEAIATATAAEARARSLAFTNVRKGIYRVEQNVLSLGVPAHVMPSGWVRQYNAALSAGTGGQAEAAAGAPGATAGADAAPSGITEWDVLENHADNAEKWAECRSQVRGLLQFIEATD